MLDSLILLCLCVPEKGDIMYTVNCFIFASTNFSSNCEKRQFHQYVNSSFQDYQNIVCHRVNFLKNMCLAHITDMYICLALV